MHKYLMLQMISLLSPVETNDVIPADIRTEMQSTLTEVHCMCKSSINHIIAIRDANSECLWFIYLMIIVSDNLEIKYICANTLQYLKLFLEILYIFPSCHNHGASGLRNTLRQIARHFNHSITTFCDDNC